MKKLLDQRNPIRLLYVYFTIYIAFALLSYSVISVLEISGGLITGGTKLSNIPSIKIFSGNYILPALLVLTLAIFSSANSAFSYGRTNIVIGRGLSTDVEVLGENLFTLGLNILLISLNIFAGIVYKSNGQTYHDWLGGIASVLSYFSIFNSIVLSAVCFRRALVILSKVINIMVKAPSGIQE